MAGDPDATQIVLLPERTVFGRFVLEAEIGSGGMGVVWRARDQMLGGVLALKFLSPAIAGNPAAIEALKEETRRARQLSHPNIVRLHEFWQDIGACAVAMELVDGLTLAQLRERAPDKVLSPDEVTPLLAQICSALDYAHTHAKIAHRDLKPSNILVTAGGVVKITDFGIARPITEGARVGTQPAALGSVSFMSPQQLRGEPPAPSDDVYALGVTLCELLTGRLPFEGADVTRKILNLPPDSPARLRAAYAPSSPPLPPRWDQTILRCLDKDPAKRPASAGAVLAGVSPLASTNAPALPLPPPPVPLPAAARPRRGGRTAIVLVILAIAGLLAFRPWEKKEEPKIVATPPAPTKTEPIRSSASVAPRSDLPKSDAPRVDAPKVDAPKSQAPGGSSNATQNRASSLGLSLQPIGPGRWMSVTLVRKADFAVYAAAAKPPLASTLTSVGREGWVEIRGSWQNPGFAQNNDHPVVGVSWQEAQAFCRWLTDTERAAGKIDAKQRYRLPREAEWAAAAGAANPYPWGGAWPPPAASGNFAGTEVASTNPPWPDDWSTIDGYNDGFARTSRVGAFSSLGGFADLTGNVQQWCEDAFDSDGPNRVLRGASWADYRPKQLRTDARQGAAPDFRAATIGFRIVLTSD